MERKKRMKSFEPVTCNPAAKHNSFSCYTTQQLTKLRDEWNQRHPDNSIEANSGKAIWESLRDKTSDVCNRESCWIRQKFAEKLSSSNLLQYAFAPKSPVSWEKNPNEWLTSTDITRVMRRYEDSFDSFEFIGPAPIDFDTVIDGQCVWNELCGFSIADCRRRNKRSIGIVFNTDPHYKSGSHWIALYIDIPKRTIYFFDSNGNPCPKQIRVFIDKIVRDDGFSFGENSPRRHQLTNTECGMYCLYFISTILVGQHSTEYFGRKRIPDRLVEAHRKKFFRDTDL